MSILKFLYFRKLLSRICNQLTKIKKQFGKDYQPNLQEVQVMVTYQT